MKDDRLYLIHVMECIAYILEFTADFRPAWTPLFIPRLLRRLE
jgi:hypothetical protein